MCFIQLSIGYHSDTMVKDTTIPIINFDEVITGKPNIGKSKNGSLLPHNARIILIGRSNSGKTNTLLNLIFNKNGLKFKHLYLFSNSLYQDKYEFLKKVFSKIKCVTFHLSDNTDMIKHPNKVERNSLVIFDDLQLSNVPQIRNYFTMGRHREIDTAYLVQSYGSIKKHHIRDNANMLIIFKLDQLNLKLIYRDFVGEDMSFSEFRKLCWEVWSNAPHKFLSIFTECKAENGRYREQLDKFIKIPLQ